MICYICKENELKLLKHMDITPLLSNNALSMRRSQIRDLLSVATRPEIISFAGGFPIRRPSRSTS